MHLYESVSRCGTEKPKLSPVSGFKHLNNSNDDCNCYSYLLTVYQCLLDIYMSSQKQSSE